MTSVPENGVRAGLVSGGRPRRIVLSFFGSLGDLHPYLAIARGLLRRGHEPIIATSEIYRRRVEALGLAFQPIPPDVPDPNAASELFARVMDARAGSERIFREMVYPSLRATYETTLAAAAGADLLVSHPLALAIRLVSERTGIPWVSTMVQPLGFFSASDPPELSAAPWVSKLGFLGPAYYRAIYRVIGRVTDRWNEPWRALRREIGLPPSADDPLMAGQHSPLLVLALFSPLFAPKQPDWPPQTVVTGFPFFEHAPEATLAPELVRFLADGPPPIVFTLGSAAVMDAGSFYEESVEAVRRLGQRAVLLTGHDPRNVPSQLADAVLAVPYAPYEAIFPRAAVIVHQGGIGTTGQALRAGRPMLVVPWAHDQPDNARRVTRLGVARTIARHRYTADRAAKQLQYLLEAPLVAQRAAEAGAVIQEEDGIAVACALLEDVLDRVAPVTVVGVSG
jgi:UDP:flavonoid glycosyltransferase YjiC (YdhE family)